MVTEKLPTCLCGSRNFKGGGGSFGGRGSQEFFSCQSCGRSFNYIQHACSIIITTTEVPVKPESGRKVTCGGQYSSGPGDSDWVPCKFHAADLPRFNEIYKEQVEAAAKGKSWYGHSDAPEPGAYTAAEVLWLQTTLEAHIRTKQEQSRVTRVRLEQTHHEIACDELGVPHGMKFKESRDDPTDTEGSKPYKRQLRIWQKPDGTEITDQAFDKAYLARIDQLRGLLGWDGNLSTVSIPPQIPASLKVAIPEARFNDDPAKNWRWVGAEESKAVPVPVDPLRVAHDKAFNGLFARVEAATGLKIDRKEVPNGYYNDTLNSEPWYTFTVGNRDFIVGPRKSVINMEVKSVSKMPTAYIRALAERDNVTYEADGYWKSPQEESKSILIHAYGVDKAVEYLSMLIETTAPSHPHLVLGDLRLMDSETRRSE